MNEINCPFRSMIGEQPVCQIVSDIVERPLSECHTNDSACKYCMGCGIAPQNPNCVTASMSIGVAHRTGDPTFLRQVSVRMAPHLNKAEPPQTACVRRGREVRQVACKPCQADSNVPVMMPVYSCPLHQECTLHNTGTFPRIKACSTCEDRLEKPVPITPKPMSPAVAAAARNLTQKIRPLGNPHAK